MIPHLSFASARAAWGPLRLAKLRPGNMKPMPKLLLEADAAWSGADEGLGL